MVPALIAAIGTGDDMAEAARWHETLESGRRLHVALDTGSATDVPALVKVVGDSVVGKRFREVTARRARLVLGELLENVAAHAPTKTAQVEVEIHVVGLRGIEVSVSDSGGGPPEDILADYTQRFVDGDREHGLLLAARLSTAIAFTRSAGGSGCHCYLVEPGGPPALTKRPDVGWVRLEYASPPVLWVGRDDSYVQPRPGGSFDDDLSTVEGRLADALRRRSRPLLGLYFGALDRARHVVYELTGDDVGSIAMGTIHLRTTVGSALELYLTRQFAERRVVFVAHDTTRGVQDRVRERSAELGCPYFDSVEACQRYLEAL